MPSSSSPCLTSLRPDRDPSVREVVWFRSASIVWAPTQITHSFWWQRSACSRTWLYSSMSCAITRSACRWIQRRGLESTVVVHPASKDGVIHRRELAQFLVALELQVPAPHMLPHRPQCVSANRRREVHVDPFILVDGDSQSKCVAQKRKLDVRMRLLPVDVLAVDNPRLLWMQFEPTLLQLSSELIECQPCPCFALAVNRTIVRVACSLYQLHQWNRQSCSREQPVRRSCRNRDALWRSNRAISKDSVRETEGTRQRLCC